MDRAEVSYMGLQLYVFILHWRPPESELMSLPLEVGIVQDKSAAGIAVCDGALVQHGNER